MKISIVTTLYNSAPYIGEFCSRVGAVAKQLAGEDFEIILVDDGSPDNSCSIAIELAKKNSHVTVVELSRNFGHHKALLCGLAHACGKRIFLIDCDLEEAPEWLLSFNAQMDTNDSDVVYGVQRNRKGGWFERWSGKWFYKFFNFLTKCCITENMVTARLMTNRYVQALLLHHEHEIFLAGLWHITGFLQSPQFVKKTSTSATTYTFNKKVSLLINAVTSFSSAPLVSIFYIGISISFFALIYIGYLVTYWILFGTVQIGWTSVIASVWLLGGMIISFIGVIGIYLSKIFSEVKQRPNTIVREIYGKKCHPSTQRY